MLSKRRRFIATFGLVGGSQLIGGQSPLRPVGFVGRAEREVGDVICRYGIPLDLSRAGEKDVALKVRVGSAAAFTKVFNPERSLPFDRIYVRPGNVLKFVHRGVTFTVHNTA